MFVCRHIHKTSGIDNGAYPKDNITTHYAEVTPFAGNMKFYQTIDEYNEYNRGNNLFPDFGNDSPYLFTPMYEASFKGTKR